MFAFIFDSIVQVHDVNRSRRFNHRVQSKVVHRCEVSHRFETIVHRWVTANSTQNIDIMTFIGKHRRHLMDFIDNMQPSTTMIKVSFQIIFQTMSVAI